MNSWYFLSTTPHHTKQHGCKNEGRGCEPEATPSKRKKNTIYRTREYINIWKTIVNGGRDVVKQLRGMGIHINDQSNKLCS